MQAFRRQVRHADEDLVDFSAAGELRELVISADHGEIAHCFDLGAVVRNPDELQVRQVERFEQTADHREGLGIGPVEGDPLLDRALGGEAVEHGADRRARDRQGDRAEEDEEKADPS